MSSWIVVCLLVLSSMASSSALNRGQGSTEAAPRDGGPHEAADHVQVLDASALAGSSLCLPSSSSLEQTPERPPTSRRQGARPSSRSISCKAAMEEVAGLPPPRQASEEEPAELREEEAPPSPDRSPPTSDQVKLLLKERRKQMELEAIRSIFSRAATARAVAVLEDPV